MVNKYYIDYKKLQKSTVLIMIFFCVAAFKASTFTILLLILASGTMCQIY